MAISRLMESPPRWHDMGESGDDPTAIPAGSDNLNQTAGRNIIMLSWSLTFLVIALIAGVLGFTGLAGTAAGVAKILFFVFLVLLLISAIAGAARGRPPV